MAVKGAIASKNRNAGQTCVCANRILVQNSVYNTFTKRLAETAGAMKAADGFEPGPVIGPRRALTWSPAVIVPPRAAPSSSRRCSPT
jgi:acyl-CoA reductase-like NAD-dependent aldehyde dehydrogenase